MLISNKLTLQEEDVSFDVFRSQDGSVFKYIHEDGSETAVKRVLSEKNILNPITRKMEHHTSE